MEAAMRVMIRRFSSPGAPILALSLLLVGLPTASGEAPGTAKGSFSIDGKAVSLSHAYAMSQPDKFDAKKTNTAILLTEKPLPAGALDKLTDLEGAQRGERRNSVLFVLDETGKAVREVIRHDSLGDMSLQMSGMTHAQVSSTAGPKGRIQGSAKTKEPEEFLDHKYQIDASFDAPVQAAMKEPPVPDAKTGKRLPPGGGDPGKEYLAFHAAVQKKDASAVRKWKPADMPDVSDEELKQGLELMAAMSPPKINVDDGYVAGDSAVLSVSGIVDGEKQYGTIRMVRSEGAWRMTKQKWSNKPPSP
jgi:hypothetical protein